MEESLLSLFKKTEDENVKTRLALILYDVIEVQCPNCKEDSKLIYFQNEWGFKTDICYECRRNASTQTMEEYLQERGDLT